MARQWAKAPYDREQMTLLSPSVDEMIPDDHQIRLLDFLLKQLDWSSWEERFKEGGTPPIHPRLVAGCILWGLMNEIRSSRRLEEATRYRTDFMWLLNGRTIDHSTIANFRTTFAKPLEELSGEIKRKAFELLGRKLGTVAIDGTLIRANSNWRGTKTAAALERSLSQIGISIGELLVEMGKQDAEGDNEEIEGLRKKLKAMEAKQDKFKRALKTANDRDEQKKKSRKATRVPVTDPDASLLKSKEGGYAANYLPVAAADVETGLIIHEEVLPHGKSEGQSMVDAVDSCKGILGQGPTALIADSGFACGQTLKTLEDQSVPFFIPVQSHRGADVALRSDPTQPLSEDVLARLPRLNKIFAKASFVYDENKNCFYCPAGKRLDHKKTFNKKGENGTFTTWEYGTKACLECPLKSQCTKSKTNRTICRDEFEPLRGASTERLKTDEGKALYKKRAPVIEGVFGLVKHVMGVRQFLTRGHDKVSTEWLWICTAFNLKKLLKIMGNNPISQKISSSKHPCLPSGRFFNILWPNRLPFLSNIQSLRQLLSAVCLAS